MDPDGERRVLIAGVGNVFRTDDGFGPAVARCLAGLPLPAGVRVEDYGIRGLHLAYDLLDPWDALILVDALPDTGDVGGVVLMDITDEQAPESAQVDAHGMDPATVLVAVAALGGRLPPCTLLVGCQIADTTDGMGLTPPVEAAVEVAARAVRAVVTGELQSAEVA